MKLTVKQQAFVDYYTDPQSETYGNAVRSYLKAGYRENSGVRQSACRELAKAHIKKAIEAKLAERPVKTEVTRDYVVSKLQEQLEKADSAADRTNALRALQLLGQSIAMFTDKVQTETVNAPELAEDEAEAIREAAKVAKLRLSRTGS